MELGIEACKRRRWPGVPRVFLDNNKEGLSIPLLHAVTSSQSAIRPTRQAVPWEKIRWLSLISYFTVCPPK